MDIGEFYETQKFADFKKAHLEEYEKEKERLFQSMPMTDEEVMRLCEPTARWNAGDKMNDYGRVAASLIKLGKTADEAAIAARNVGDKMNDEWRVAARLVKLGMSTDHAASAAFAASGPENCLGYPDKTLKSILRSLGPKPQLVRIVARCGQMYRQAETGGEHTSYGVWRGVLSLCKFTEVSDEDIQELTGQHKDFDISVAHTKMADISAPFSCDSLGSDDREICKKCKFYGSIKSPISLAYEHEPRVNK